VKTTVRRFIPTLNRSQLALAGLAAAGVVAGIAGPAAAAASAHAPTSAASTSAAATVPAAHTAPAGSTSTGSTSTASTVAHTAPAPAAPAPAAPASKSVHYSFQLQSTGWYCGPSATRVALSAQGKTFTQDQVAGMLGTTVDGTPSANDVTRVLNAQLGAGKYHTVELSGAKASTAQIDKLKADVVAALNQGKPVVANIAGTVTDDNGDVHSYEGGHYLPIVGYSHNGDTVKIADSADTVGSPTYDISTAKVANWIATRGYAA
jgi:Peptidase_C39 like family